MTILELLNYAMSSGASDVFITANKPASFRISGVLQLGSDDPVSEAEIDQFRRETISADAEKEYRKNGSVDAALGLENGERFRINYFNSTFGPAMAARPIHAGGELFFESLGLPLQLGELSAASQGLILVCGSSGCGKSTTVGAIVNYINQNFSRHVIMLESPTEFIHFDQQSLISQRDVGAGSIELPEAVATALRESPDVLTMCEVRDAASARAMLKAALSGHLVIAELIASDAVQALEQLYGWFPAEEHKTLSENLSALFLGATAQRLLPMADGSGQIAAVEFLRSGSGVRKLLLDGDLSAIRESLRRGSDNGTICFTKALLHLVRNNFISEETAYAAESNTAALELLLKGDSQTEAKRYGTPDDAAEGDVIDLPKLLRTAVKVGASDLHLSVGAQPTMRVHGELRQLSLPFLRKEDTERLLFGMISPRQRLNFEERRELDLAIAIPLDSVDENGEPETCRFRVNAYFQRGYVGVVARVITSKIPSPESLNLPQSIIDLTEKSQGLILVTGPTGSGKSTTLASLIDQINRTRPEHIITIEDPIEYVHKNKTCLIQQREVHADTLSFSGALKSALRQDPDVILVGEMRDTETIGAALTAAETGHLVMATLHTNSAAQTIDRIIDTFPPEQQNQVKLQLSSCVIGIISQRLLSRADTEGRIAAFEILIGTPPVQALIREGKTSMLPSILETGYKDGMITMRRSLEELLERGLIYEDEAKSLTLEAVEVNSFE